MGSTSGWPDFQELTSEITSATVKYSEIANITFPSVLKVFLNKISGLCTSDANAASWDTVMFCKVSIDGNRICVPPVTLFVIVIPVWANIFWIRPAFMAVSIDTTAFVVLNNIPPDFPIFFHIVDVLVIAVSKLIFFETSIPLIMSTTFPVWVRSSCTLFSWISLISWIIFLAFFPMMYSTIFERMVSPKLVTAPPIAKPSNKNKISVYSVLEFC